MGCETYLQPRDALCIEMIRRLIEEQQIVSLNEQPRERHAALLASGERCNLGIARRAAQCHARAINHTVELPEILRFNLLLQD